jgi:hypothetical protein
MTLLDYFFGMTLLAILATVGWAVVSLGRIFFQALRQVQRDRGGPWEVHGIGSANVDAPDGRTVSCSPGPGPKHEERAHAMALKLRDILNRARL